MRPEVTSGIRWAIFFYASTLSVAGQSAAQAGPAVGAPSKSTQVASSPEAAGQIYREIDDPRTGNRWLLLRDVSHPGGPGHLVLTEKAGTAQDGSRGSSAKADSKSEPDANLPVIHTGDRLIVERETATIAERLEAVALGTAARGSLFNVRLKIGGKVFRAIATGPGRATFAAEPFAAEHGARQ